MTSWSAPELSLEERAILARHRESQRKRGAYWLTPEGREELREVFDNPNDGSAVRPLLDALEAAERERDEACVALGLMLGTYEAFVDAHGGGGLGIDHLDGCPEDDTCECPLYVLARKAEARARAVLSRSEAPDPAAGTLTATETTADEAPGETPNPKDQL